MRHTHFYTYTPYILYSLWLEGFERVLPLHILHTAYVHLFHKRNSQFFCYTFNCWYMHIYSIFLHSKDLPKAKPILKVASNDSSIRPEFCWNKVSVFTVPGLKKAYKFYFSTTDIHIVRYFPKISSELHAAYLPYFDTQHFICGYYGVPKI